uniref:PQQ-like domain-containing protein n=1 Tax=Candidatus Kentrum sp. TC TaxID=2126339 RepID=A0A450Y7A1_9GAMM|nr:MAG: PQQ-like domain-containing protein [Candidatus Kentron sp. TC]
MSSTTENARIADYLFVGTYGHVVAVDKRDGKILWKTSLPFTGYKVVSILFEDGRLFCASGGRVFALDPRNSAILWSNGLSRMGSGVVFLSTVSSNNTEIVLSLLEQIRTDNHRHRTANSSATSSR